MKHKKARLTGVFCACTFLLNPAEMSVSAAETDVAAPQIMGDLNGDYRVTIEDAKRALDIVVGRQVGLCENNVSLQNNPADIDLNGMIEMMDALNIMRYFCQTLAGEQPLWADLRRLSYEDGTGFHSNYVSDGDAEKGKTLPFEKRGMYLEIGCAEGKPGETVAIPVYLAGIKEFAGMQYFQTAPPELELCGLRSILTSDEEDAEGNPVPKSPDGSNGVFNKENGGFIWANEKGENLKVEKGTVIAEYFYTIPEYAQAGDLFVISADKSDTLFVTVDDSDDFRCLGYQYTLLDGVIKVTES